MLFSDREAHHCLHELVLIQLVIFISIVRVDKLVELCVQALSFLDTVKGFFIGCQRLSNFVKGEVAVAIGIETAEGRAQDSIILFTLRRYHCCLELFETYPRIKITVQLLNHSLHLFSAHGGSEEVTHGVKLKLRLIITSSAGLFTVLILLAQQVIVLKPALLELLLVLLRTSHESDHDLLHDARLAHGFHTLSNNRLLIIVNFLHLNVLKLLCEMLFIKNSHPEERHDRPPLYWVVALNLAQKFLHFCAYRTLEIICAVLS